LQIEAAGTWERFRWLNEPSEWSVEDRRLTLRANPHSDFWRHTETGHVQHDGNVFGRDCPGDFVIETVLDGDLAAAYDQLGVVAIQSEEVWLKASVELDETLWLGAVKTDGTSDWSREPLASLPVTIRLDRVGATFKFFVRENGSWRMCRLFTLDGPLLVGPYACAPSGEGFRARIDLLQFAQGSGPS
jgi:regulation of enolase protein 1 (concanavalin A-like superfamily)